MATVITPRGKSYLAPNMVLEFGDFSSTDTSTATLNVSGGYVISIEFFDANANSLSTATSSTVTLSSKTLSGSVTSFTVTPGGAITGGTYRVIHGGA